MEATDYVFAVKRGLIKFSAARDFAHRNPNGLGGRSFLVDSRGSGSDPELRNLIVTALDQASSKLPPYDVITGVANSGTHWAALLAYKQNRPFANILKEPRKSGMKRQIEGSIEGKRLLLIDDWMNTGGSILTTVEIVKAYGGIPAGLLVLAGQEMVSHSFEFPYEFAISTQKLIETALELDLIPSELHNEF